MAGVNAPLYLVRHGESEWNLSRLTQGQTHHPRLTPFGRAQAKDAGEAIRADLARGDGVRIVSSDLVRAVETAHLIADELRSPVEIDARLREQHLGRLEGRPYEETFAIAQAHDWSDMEAPVAGGESPAQLGRRMRSALSELDPTVPAVVVSHGDALRAVLEVIRPSAEREWLAVPNGAVFRVARPSLEGTSLRDCQAPSVMLRLRAGPGLS